MPSEVRCGLHLCDKETSRNDELFWVLVPTDLHSTNRGPGR